MLVTSSTFKGIFQTCRFLKCVSFHRCPSPEEAATVWAQRPILGDLQCCPRLVQWFSDQLSDSGQTGGLCLRLPHDRSWLPAGKPADFYCSEKSWMNLFIVYNSGRGCCRTQDYRRSELLKTETLVKKRLQAQKKYHRQNTVTEQWTNNVVSLNLS